MRITVLGPITAGDRAAPRPIPARRQRLLLATLALHAPRAVSADRLADVQWPARSPADPAAALQTLLSRLRAALGDARAVERQPSGYRLAVAPDAIDAMRFEALLARSRSAPTPARGLALVEEALALWRGDPYEEFADVPAFAGEVARLRELRMTAHERRIELLLVLGRVEEAAALAEPLVRDDPLRERPRALLMEAASRAGRAGDALATYQEYRRRLAEELGLEPSPALRELELQVIRHEQSMRPGERPLAASTTDVAPLPPLRVAFAPSPRRPGRIAWASVGDGAPLLVLPAWVSSLAAIGAGLDPRVPLLAALAARCALTVHDRPGMGLSRAESGGDARDDVSIDDDVDDAIAVMDAAGVERATVLAVSQAGPVSLTMAARYPERVSRLVLLGTYACGPTAFPRADVRASVLALIRAHWGLGSRVLAELIVPGVDDARAATFARLQREAAAPEVAARALERLYEADASALLPRVRQPALVVHYTGDVAVPFHAGQALAAALPDARLVALPGRMHLPPAADAVRVAALVADFIG